MKYIVFLICTIIVIGCSGSDSSTITNTMETMKAPRYTVYADDIFTDNHKVDIVAALEEWNAKTKIMQYDIQFVPTQYLEKSAEEPNTIYIWMTDPVSSSGSNLLGWTAWDEKTNGAYMYITPNMTDDQLFTAVMLHEFGHAFHLIHYTLPNLSIMHPIVCEDTCHVECVDIKAFCKIWNCSTECAITPDAVLPTNTLIEEVNINTCSLSK